MSSVELRPIGSRFARKEVNMIKRLFFRKKLRLILYCDYGASCPEFEKIFNWIYEAPLWDWKIRLDLAYRAYHQQSGKDKSQWLSKAEEALRFIRK